MVVSGVTRRQAGAVQYSLNSVTRLSQAAARHVTSDDLSIPVSYSSIFQLFCYRIRNSIKIFVDS